MSVIAPVIHTSRMAFLLRTLLFAVIPSSDIVIMKQRNCTRRFSACVTHEQSSPLTTHLAVISLGQVLSHGGNWVLRLAQLPSSKYIAVKVLNKAYLLRSKQIMHAFNERVFLVKMRDCPFIVQYIGTMQDARNLYCVMAFEQGGDLFSKIYNGNRLSTSHAQFYLAEVVIAISHLHAFGCIYRDLKPENILLSSTGHVKIWNFGLSKFIRRGERTYTACGTPEYLAPEVIEGSGYDFAVDWWQVGILLYEMIAGRTPFVDSDPYTLYQRILTEPVEFPLRMFSSAAEHLISWLLSKDPSQRARSQNVLQHQFFQGVNWPEATALSSKPPFIPVLAGPGDTHYYEKVDDEQSLEELSDKWQQMLFYGY